MAETAAGSLAPGAFQVTLEMCPATDHEANARVHFYAALMAMTISELLKKTVMEIRKEGPKQESEALRQAAQKEYSVSQLITATKEVCLNWLQQDAMEQGSEAMSEWLAAFFQAAASAIDYKYPEPPLSALTPAYQFCLEKSVFCRETASRVCRALGFIDLDGAFDRHMKDILVLSPARENILEKALTLPIDQIRKESLW